MSTSPAQHLFNLMSSDEVGEDTLGLLKHLSQSGAANLQSPVAINGRTLPMRRAILELVEPGKYAPSFYKADTARQLLELDPAFFQQGVSGPNTVLWLGETIAGWARHEHRDRNGFSNYHASTIDQWACAAIASLPKAHKENDALWKGVLKLGLQQAACLLAPHRPGGWAEVDEKGKPAIASAGGNWAWTRALEAGVDPYALIQTRSRPSGQPFWRAMLPQSPTGPGEPGSVRASVEAWVCNESKRPDSDPALLDYLRRLALARMNVISGSNAWGLQSRKQQLEFVSTLPPAWVNWPRLGLPTWLGMAMHRHGDLPVYLVAVQKHPEWCQEIAKDPLSQLALDILVSAPNMPRHDQVQANLPLALEDPRAPKVLDFVANLAKCDPAALRAELASLSLSAQTPPSPGQRPRPRF